MSEENTSFKDYTHRVEYERKIFINDDGSKPSKGRDILEISGCEEFQAAVNMGIISWRIDGKLIAGAMILVVSYCPRCGKPVVPICVSEQKYRLKTTMEERPVEQWVKVNEPESS